MKPFCHLTRKGLKQCHLIRKGPLPEKISKHLSDHTGMGPVPEKTMSSHKKGTAPNQTDCCHLTRKGLLLKQIKTPKNCRNRSRNTGGSLEPCHNMWHGLATRDSDRRRLCISPSVVKQCFKRIFKHFSYCPGDSTHSVQWVIIQDKPGRVLRSFVLDRSWTPFNQRPSDSRNCCRTREEPLKPCQEIILSSTLFFLMETN